MNSRDKNQSLNQDLDVLLAWSMEIAMSIIIMIVIRKFIIIANDRAVTMIANDIGSNPLRATK